MEKYYTKEDLKNSYKTGSKYGYDGGVEFEEYFDDLENHNWIGQEMFSKEDVENILKEFIKENSTTPNIDLSLVEVYIEEYKNLNK